MSKGLIVVVDDNKTIRSAARMFLEEEGFEIKEAIDGFSGLALIQESQPDLLFLDITMPRLDGYQMCLMLRENPDFQELPIVMLSGKDTPFDQARGTLMGSDDYLTKPFTKKELLDCVKKYLHHKN